MPDLETIASDTEAAAVAALSARPIKDELHGTPMLLLPKGGGAWEMRLAEEALPAPTRKRGTVIAHEVDSFVEIVKRHGSLADCTVYIDVDYGANRVKAVAVLNDHGADSAGWRDHRAIFEPRFTEEWARWTRNNRQPMEQVKLAHFLEENIGDIAAPANTSLPTGADVLAFVSRLEDTRKVKYGSAVNLQNGAVQIEFIEDDDKAQRGRLELFREFAIGVRPFLNGDAYQVRAFLRYRIDRNTGQITFWYELQRADRVLEDACRATVEAIRAKTGLTVVFGLPG